MSLPVLRVCALYPELMNIYADRGNIAVLRARCEWRGLGFELSSSSVGESLDADSADLFYIGGGQDRDQIAVAGDMAATKRDAMHRAADRGAAVLAVCGGYQLLGHSYQLGEEELPGIGLVDLRTVREPGERLIGNCAIESSGFGGDGEPRVIAGFENHGGRTYLGDASLALGRVLAGHGNNGRDGLEGVHDRNVIGTYLHGPLLPKNVWLADRLIELALGVELDPLDDRIEAAAHASALAARRACERTVLILLAPSEGKAAAPPGPPIDLGALAHAEELTATRERVLEALIRLAGGRSRKRARDNLGLSPSQDGELDVDAALRTAPAAPASAVYTGVLYQHLGLSELAPAARARAAETVLVASALWGVVGLADRIPAYRLSMNATIPSLRRTLPAIWRKPLAAALPDEPDGLVLDLRSGTYAAAWQPRRATVVQVRALTPEGKVISHMAKATRGRVARAVLEATSQPREPGALLRLAGESARLVEPAKPGGPHVIEIVERSPAAG